MKKHSQEFRHESRDSGSLSEHRSGTCTFGRSHISKLNLEKLDLKMKLRMIFEPSNTIEKKLYLLNNQQKIEFGFNNVSDRFAKIFNNYNHHLDKIFPFRIFSPLSEQFQHKEATANERIIEQENIEKKTQHNSSTHLKRQNINKSSNTITNSQDIEISERYKNFITQYVYTKIRNIFPFIKEIEIQNKLYCQYIVNTLADNGKMSQILETCFTEFDKLTDGNITSFMMMKHFDFLYSNQNGLSALRMKQDSSQQSIDFVEGVLRMLELIINPSVFAVTFFNFSLMKLDSNDMATKEKQYTLSTLPRISLINLDGFDTPLNFLLLREFNKTTQYISLYDDDTQGYFEQSMYQQNQQLRQQREDLNGNGGFSDDFSEIMKSAKYPKNVFFYPLSSKNMTIKKNQQKAFSNIEIQESTQNTHQIRTGSKQFMYLFRQTVLPLLRFFNPDLIVISYSLAMNDESHPKINNHNLKTKAWIEIIKNLCTIANFQVVFIPRIIRESEDLQLSSLVEMQSKYRNLLAVSIDNPLNLRRNLRFIDHISSVMEKFSFNYEKLAKASEYILAIYGHFALITTGEVSLKSLNYRQNFVQNSKIKMLDSFNRYITYSQMIQSQGIQLVRSFIPTNFSNKKLLKLIEKKNQRLPQTILESNRAADYVLNLLEKVVLDLGLPSLLQSESYYRKESEQQISKDDSVLLNQVTNFNPITTDFNKNDSSFFTLNRITSLPTNSTTSRKENQNSSEEYEPEFNQDYDSEEIVEIQVEEIQEEVNENREVNLDNMGKQYFKLPAILQRSLGDQIQVVKDQTSVSYVDITQLMENLQISGYPTQKFERQLMNKNFEANLNDEDVINDDIQESHSKQGQANQKEGPLVQIRNGKKAGQLNFDYSLISSVINQYQAKSISLIELAIDTSIGFSLNNSAIGSSINNNNSTQKHSVLHVDLYYDESPGCTKKLFLDSESQVFINYSEKEVLIFNAKVNQVYVHYYADLTKIFRDNMENKVVGRLFYNDLLAQNQLKALVFPTIVRVKNFFYFFYGFNVALDSKEFGRTIPKFKNSQDSCQNIEVSNKIYRLEIVRSQEQFIITNNPSNFLFQEILVYNEKQDLQDGELDEKSNIPNTLGNRMFATGVYSVSNSSKNEVHEIYLFGGQFIKQTQDNLNYCNIVTRVKIPKPREYRFNSETEKVYVEIEEISKSQVKGDGFRGLCGMKAFHQKIDSSSKSQNSKNKEREIIIYGGKSIDGITPLNQELIGYLFTITDKSSSSEYSFKKIIFSSRDGDKIYNSTLANMSDTCNFQNEFSSEICGTVDESYYTQKPLMCQSNDMTIRLRANRRQFILQQLLEEKNDQKFENLNHSTHPNMQPLIPSGVSVGSAVSAPPAAVHPAVTYYKFRKNYEKEVVTRLMNTQYAYILDSINYQLVEKEQKSQNSNQLSNNHRILQFIRYYDPLQLVISVFEEKFDFLLKLIDKQNQSNFMFPLLEQTKDKVHIKIESSQCYSNGQPISNISIYTFYMVYQTLQSTNQVAPFQTYCDSSNILASFNQVGIADPNLNSEINQTAVTQPFLYQNPSLSFRFVLVQEGSIQGKEKLFQYGLYYFCYETLLQSLENIDFKKILLTQIKQFDLDIALDQQSQSLFVDNGSLCIFGGGNYPQKIPTEDEIKSIIEQERKNKFLSTFKQDFQLFDDDEEWKKCLNEQASHDHQKSLDHLIYEKIKTLILKKPESVFALNELQSLIFTTKKNAPEKLHQFTGISLIILVFLILNKNEDLIEEDKNLVDEDGLQKRFNILKEFFTRKDLQIPKDIKLNSESTLISFLDLLVMENPTLDDSIGYHQSLDQFDILDVSESEKRFQKLFEICFCFQNKDSQKGEDQQIENSSHFRFQFSDISGSVSTQKQNVNQPSDNLQSSNSLQSVKLEEIDFSFQTSLFSEILFSQEFFFNEQIFPFLTDINVQGTKFNQFCLESLRDSQLKVKYLNITACTQLKEGDFKSDIQTAKFILSLQKLKAGHTELDVVSLLKFIGPSFVSEMNELEINDCYQSNSSANLVLNSADFVQNYYTYFKELQYIKLTLLKSKVDAKKQVAFKDFQTNFPQLIEFTINLTSDQESSRKSNNSNNFVNGNSMSMAIEENPSQLTQTVSVCSTQKENQYIDFFQQTVELPKYLQILLRKQSQSQSFQNQQQFDSQNHSPLYLLTIQSPNQSNFLPGNNDASEKVTLSKSILQEIPSPNFNLHQPFILKIFSPGMLQSEIKLAIIDSNVHYTMNLVTFELQNIYLNMAISNGYESLKQAETDINFSWQSLQVSLDKQILQEYISPDPNDQGISKLNVVKFDFVSIQDTRMVFTGFLNISIHKSSNIFPFSFEIEQQAFDQKPRLHKQTQIFHPIFFNSDSILYHSQLQQIQLFNLQNNEQKPFNY